MIHNSSNKNRLNDLNENNKVKFRSPWGPIKYFIKTAETGFDLVKATEQWRNLDSHSEYISKFNEEHHDYVVKRYEFVSYNRNKNKHSIARTPFIIYTDDIQQTFFNNNNKKKFEFFDFAFYNWTKILSQTERFKYNKKSEMEKDQLEKYFTEKIKMTIDKDKKDLKKINTNNGHIYINNNTELHSYLSTESSQN